jgi:phosphoglycerol transferase MdoB-like AlkP superfamily enzyme
VFSAVLVLKVALARQLIFGAAGFNPLGLLSETAFIVLVLSLVEFVVRGKWPAFLVLDAAISAALVAMVMFAAFYGRMPSPDALALVEEVGTVRASVLALVRPVMVLFFADLVVVGVVMAVRRGVRRRPIPAKWLLRTLGASFLACAVIVSPAFAAQSADDLLAARKQGILGRTVVLFTQSPAVQAAAVDITDPDALQNRIEMLRRRSISPRGGAKWAGAAAGRHLIVIQVESMQAFAVGLKVAGRPVTPNLDRLSRDAFVFERMFQQVGAGNTSDAEFMLDTSLYALNTKSVAKTHGSKQFPSMPRMLEDAGYATLTLHADDIEYWNRDELYPALGYDTYYARDFFGDEDIVGIGPSDDVMFSKGVPVLRALSQEGRPFYARFMTLTTHHPFRLPEAKRTLRLPGEFEGTLAGDYVVSMHYVDAAIGRFISQLKRDGLYEDSVIVVTGDHAGLGLKSLSIKDRRTLARMLGRPYSPVDTLRLPLIVAVPGAATGQRVGTIGGQVDIMPTLLNLLGVPIEGQVHFGTDLLNTTTNLVGSRYYVPTGTFLRDGILFTPGVGFDDGEVTRLDVDQSVPDRGDLRDDYDRVLELERLNDAYLDTLPERGIEADQ